MGNITLHTPYKHAAAIAAKTDLATQGYKCYTGIEYVLRKAQTPRPLPAVQSSGLGPSHASGSVFGSTHPPARPQVTQKATVHPTIPINTGLTLVPTQVPEYHNEAKLLSLLKIHDIGALVQYTVQPSSNGQSFTADLSVDGRAFQAKKPTAASAKDAVAEKALSMFTQVLSPVPMVPAPGFEILKCGLRMLTPGTSELYIREPKSVTINSFDEQGQPTVSYEYDLRAVTQLGELLQATGRPKAQWYEREKATFSGEPMYACLLHWASGSKIFGQLDRGYPDRTFARTRAAMSALRWLAEEAARQEDQNRSINASHGPTQPKDASIAHQAHLFRPATHASDLDKTNLFRPATRASDPDKTNLFRPGTRSSDPVKTRDLLITNWSQLSGKRPAPDGLFKENQPFKKVKPSNDDCASDGFNRVEHVDGRFGF